MCATVVVEDIQADAPRWDRDRVSIIIGRGLNHFEALKQVRAMLSWLGAPQIGLGATCWCGESVTVPKSPVVVPRQKTSPRHEEAPHAR